MVVVFPSDLISNVRSDSTFMFHLHVEQQQSTSTPQAVDRPEREHLEGTVKMEL